MSTMALVGTFRRIRSIHSGHKRMLLVTPMTAFGTQLDIRQLFDYLSARTSSAGDVDNPSACAALILMTNSVGYDLLHQQVGRQFALHYPVCVAFQ